VPLSKTYIHISKYLLLFNKRSRYWWSNSSRYLSILVLNYVLTFNNIPVALSKFPDFEPEINEAAAKLTEVGAGIGIFPREAHTPSPSPIRMYTL